MFTIDNENVQTEMCARRLLSKILKLHVKGLLL